MISVAIASAAARLGDDHNPEVAGAFIIALPSRQRISVSAQHAITARTRFGACAASASEYAPPVETPIATNCEMSSASATASPSPVQSAMLRPGLGVDRPYPGRSMPTTRKPASAAAGANADGSTRLPGPPWHQITGVPFVGP